MTQKELFPIVKSSQPDTPVNHSRKQENAKAKKTLATSSRTLCKLLHPKDPLGAFSKTFTGMSAWDSTLRSLQWRQKVTPRGRLLFQLYPSEHPIEETESSSSDDLWATPNTMDHLPQRSDEALMRQATTSRKGRKRPGNLREQVDERTAAMWPTPTAMTGGTGVAPSHKEGKHGWNIGAAVNDSLSDNPTRMWPTPTTRDYKGMSGKGRQERKGNPADTLPNAVAMWPTPTANEDAAGTPNGKMQKMLGNHPEIRGASPEEWKRGALNPTWVEWLMGYPKGWTELED
jgi:DNA (cytosine-5)-methyltransferase 1